MLEFIQIVEYFDSLQMAINFCENIFWTPYSSNEHIINACGTVWEETYIYN